MFSNLRSLIFKLDPETAHNLAIKSLKFNFVPHLSKNNENDWDKITSAICNCDCYNFSLLLKIEPRLVYTAFEQEKCNALKERIEDATDSFYQSGEFHQSVIGDTTF